ncbi:MAG: T9SS type A sorting domain-containing protein, partial [Cryomorphaceae bacterium]
SDPRIYVEISSASEKEIAIPFSIVGGTAINDNVASGGDYSAAPEGGTVIFPPGVTEQFLYYNSSTGNANLIVYSNELVEEDRTILFELDDNPVNAGLGSIDAHTYTIKAYTEFEWQGVAGIGKRNDNTFWIVPDEASTGASGNIPNLSPRPIQILQDVSNRRPEVTDPGTGVNNHKMLRFDGNNDYLKIGGSGNMEGQFNLINSGGQYDYKSIFLAFRPHNVGSSTPQVIYEQGGGDRGISLYIKDSKLFFAAWNRRDDGNHSPWGQNSYLNGDISAYVESSTVLQDSETYIVSCHMGRNYSTDNSEDFEPREISGLSMYINGELEDTYTGNVGRLYTHSGRTALGAAWHQTRYVHTQSAPASGTNDVAHFYDGDIGEVLYLNEPKMNETRIRIIHNYFSALYNIELNPATQVFDLDVANNISVASPAFNYDVAGIGKIGSTVHGDSKGPAQMRVRSPSFTEENAFLMWGHNGESLTETWPFSNSTLPGNVIERSGRVWRFHTNPPGGISSAQILMSFDEAEFADEYSSNPDHLKLLIHNNSDPDDFGTAQVINVSQIMSGDVAQFSEVPISDGSYMALGNTTSIFPLPIELLNFNARNNGPVVDIYWSTASEVNNDYFVVERAGGDLVWKEIAQTPGAGNSTSTLSYIEKDRDPLPGVSYYRLRQVDYDGTSTLSDVVSVSRAEDDSASDVFLYPNPNQSHSTFVRIRQLDYNDMVDIRVLDMNGKVVRSEKLDHNGGIFEVFHGKLNPGIYLVQVESENIRETRKLVITQ